MNQTGLEKKNLVPKAVFIKAQLGANVTLDQQLQLSKSVTVPDQLVPSSGSIL